MSEAIPSLIADPGRETERRAIDVAVVKPSKGTFKGPGPMLLSMVLVAMMMVLLVGAGSASWVAYSFRSAAVKGALSVQTSILEYTGRSLIARVEQQQRLLNSLASTLAEHIREPENVLEHALYQPSSIAQQYEQVQLIDASGKLLINQHASYQEQASSLQERQRDVLTRSLAEGKPMTHAWIYSGDDGLQLEFQSASPVRDAQGLLQGVVGGVYRVSLPLPVGQDGEPISAHTQLMLIDRDFQPLVLSRKEQWQLADAKHELIVPTALNQAWLKTAKLRAVSVQKDGRLWSAMPLPWGHWSLLRVSDLQDWLPGVSSRMIGGGLALLALALLLGWVLCLIAYPLTALFRASERALQKDLALVDVNPSYRGGTWWHELSDQDWGEALILRTAIQEQGSASEVWRGREYGLKAQLQTLMDAAPVSLLMTHGKTVQHVGLPAARMLGYQSHEMQGLALSDLCVTTDAYNDLVGRIRRSLEIYGQFDGEVSLIRKDGRPIWVRIHGQSMLSMPRAWEPLTQVLDEQSLVWTLEDVTLQRQVREQPSWKAMHDALTGLPNRTAFALRLQEWLKDYATAGGMVVLSRPMAAGQAAMGVDVYGVVLYVDLDHFSLVNRMGGREVGDEVLGHIARLIDATVRPHGWLARVGGDEFAILMAGISREEGMRYAQLLCMAIQDWEGTYQGQRYMLSASIGMFLLDACHHTAASVFNGADLACDAAKRKGRNRVEVMTASG